MLIMQNKEGSGSGSFTDNFDGATLDPFWIAVPDGGTIGVSSGFAELSLPSGVTSFPRFYAAKKPSGDFDLRSVVDATGVNSTTTGAFLQCGIRVITGGYIYNIRAFDETGYNNAIGTFTDDPGATWFFDTTDFSQNVELRITRVGNTLTSYYRDSTLGEGQAWTTGSSTTVAASANTEITVFAWTAVALNAPATYKVDRVTLTYPAGELV